MNAKFKAIIDSMPTRSTWQKGVKATATEMLEQLEENGITIPTESDLLNGADDWADWASSGCGLIYDSDIARRYCSPSELKRTDDGRLPPNSRESWLDVEARAAFQAAQHILRSF